ncbi:MAG: hypothetical protein HY064_00045 [Bacteroidetes bacterium]|nr:hypothetical protein [Bacteroidota bacterium]
MQIRVMLFILLLTALRANAQHAVADPVTGITYSRLEVFGYSLIGAGITIVATEIVYQTTSPSSHYYQKPLTFVLGGVLIGTGITLVVFEKKRRHKK